MTDAASNPELPLNCEPVFEMGESLPWPMPPPLPPLTGPVFVIPDAPTIGRIDLPPPPQFDGVPLESPDPVHFEWLCPVTISREPELPESFINRCKRAWRVLIGKA